MGMCHWVLDTTRNRVIKVGRKVLAWSLDTEGPWVDISPSDWGYGFAWTKAMYYAAHDRIYFKGSKITNASDVMGNVFAIREDVLHCVLNIVGACKAG